MFLCCVYVVHLVVMVRHVQHGKDIHVQASPVTASVVGGKVVTATLYVASVVDDCFTLPCRLRQRSDVNSQVSFVIETSYVEINSYIQLFINL